LNGAVWVLRNALPGAAVSQNDPGLSPLLNILLANRGLNDPAERREFLHPTLSSLADPMDIADMGRAVNAVIRSLEEKRKIVIYGDYDADGITATALLLRFFRNLGAKASYYIPHRIAEGYGLNRTAVEKIAKSGAGLLITVDCGSSNADEILYARSLGLEVVVTDHHKLRPDAFPECPVVNPNSSGRSKRHRNLAGVGVAFFLAVAVRAALRERGWFSKVNYPDLKEYLDLVTLGTIADRAPVLGQNRILIRSGLGVMQESRWSGLEALKAVSLQKAGMVTDVDVAFRLAPRINAAGRMGDARAGLGLLMEDEPERARQMAIMLDSENNKRQSLERQTIKEAEDILSASCDLGAKRVLIAASKGWHRGVLGLVASRLAERYRCPSLIFSLEKGLAVGSARSIDGFNLFGALEKIGHLMERFGGHEQAAGITLRMENLERFKEEIEALVEAALSDEMIMPRLLIDAQLRFDQIVPRLMGDIDILRPFGEGNPEPLFMSRCVKMLRCKAISGKHLKVVLRQGSSTIEGIGFGMSDYLHMEGRIADIAYIPEVNRWQGANGIRLKLTDIRDAKDQG